MSCESTRRKLTEGEPVWDKNIAIFSLMFGVQGSNLHLLNGYASSCLPNSLTAATDLRHLFDLYPSKSQKQEATRNKGHHY